jgi:hypothetical protein
VYLAFEFLGNLVEYVADLVQPATLLRRLRIFRRKRGPETVGAVGNS